MFQKVGAILVKGFDKRFIFAADTLIGIAYHFCRHKRFTVGYALVMLDDVCLNVIQGKIDVSCT